MVRWFPRALLGLSVLILAVAGVMHAMAYGKTVAVVAASNLPVFFGNALKLFWLGDSATLLILAILFAAIAIRPKSASGSLVVLLSLLPASTAVLLYAFLGMFFAAHILLAVAVLVFIAGLQFPKSGEQL
jgi:hypothetical protein